jgi:tetratricopeptide (TPR) repeat protein
MARHSPNRGVPIQESSETLSGSIRSYEASIHVLEALASDAPDDPDIRRHLALGLRRLAYVLATCGEPEVFSPRRAAELAQRLIQLEPYNWQARTTLGIARYRAGDRARAIAPLRQALALKRGDDAITLFYLAMTYAQRGELDRAGNAYARAVRRMELRRLKDRDLQTARAEAEALLGLAEDPT